MTTFSSMYNYVYCDYNAYSCHVLNSTWSAKCAEFASIVIELVIELVIGILLSPANNYISSCEVKLQ